MRFARALAASAGVVLLAPTAGAVPAASAATVTVVTINDRPDPAVYHDEVGPETADLVRHRGKLTTVDGGPLADAIVHLEKQLPSSDGWLRLTLAEAGTTDANGGYSFLTAVEGNASYRVVFDGTPDHAPTTSPVEALEAMRDFNAVLVEKRSRAVLKGDLNPGWDNKVVRWQHKKCRPCRWTTVDRARAGDSGSWRFFGRYPRAGKEWFYRATINRTEQFAKSFSATLVTSTAASRSTMARTSTR